MPELHRSDRLLLDAAAMRARDGDEKFFTGLGGGGSGIWDRLPDAGTRPRTTSRPPAPPGDPERGKLVDALVRAYFPAFDESTDYVDLDSGLRTLATHANDLGYDAVVLFLDELMLWLASRLGNADFVANEGAKVAKLVESANARRPIPLVSLLARQRDLRDFLGEAAPGAQQAAIADTFRWWEDPLRRIVLGDENLPYIAAARRVLRLREPAALKVMQQMLFNQRNDLTVDDVGPVGDVFDFVVQGQTALDVERSGTSPPLAGFTPSGCGRCSSPNTGPLIIARICEIVALKPCRATIWLAA